VKRQKIYIIFSTVIGQIIEEPDPEPHFVGVVQAGKNDSALVM
jgi:hypothetical protein